MIFAREHELELIAALRAAPDRDDRRLEYADYMEATGHLRGRYVRCAVAAARMDLPVAQREEARRQAIRLWLESDAGTDGRMKHDLSFGRTATVRRMNDGLWVPSLAVTSEPFSPGDGARRTGLAVAVYRRGFVHRIAVNWPAAASTAPLVAVLGRAPVQILEADPPTAAAVMVTPEAAVVDELELDGVDEESVLDGWGAAVLGRLRRFQLHGPAAAGAWLRHCAKNAPPLGCVIEITGCEPSELTLTELRLAAPGGLRVGDAASPGSERPGAYARLRAAAALDPEGERPRQQLASWLERFSLDRARRIRSHPAKKPWVDSAVDLGGFDRDTLLEASEGELSCVTYRSTSWSSTVPESSSEQLRRFVQVDYEGWLAAKLTVKLGPEAGPGAATALSRVCPAPVLASGPAEATEILGEAAGAPVRALELSLQAGQEAALAALFQTAGARQLRRLRVTGAPELFRGLAAALQEPLPRLDTLEIASSCLEPAPLSRLCDDRLFPALETLSFRACRLGPEPCEVLRKSPIRLARLSVMRRPAGADEARGPLIDPDGLVAFASSPAASRLTHLRLGWCGLEPGTVRRLASCSSLSSLTNLSLVGNPLDQEDVAALLDSPWFFSLTWLDLSSTPVGQAVVEHLPRRHGMHKLMLVGLADTGLLVKEQDFTVSECFVEREVHLTAEQITARYLDSIGLRAF